MVAVAGIATVARPARGDAPSGYQCAPGSPKKGVGCACPVGYADRRIEDNVAVCVVVPKPSEAALLHAECKHVVPALDKAYGTALTGDAAKRFRTAFGELVQKRCETHAWAKDVRACFAKAKAEEAVYDCLEKLPPVQRGGLDADAARVLPTGVAIKKTELEIQGAIVFAQASAGLSETSKPMLDAIAGVLVGNPSIVVEIAVHSDADDSTKLTQQRADAIRQHLIALGVPAKQLAAKGYGNTLPVASSSTAWGRAKNRRVQFVIRPPEPVVSPGTGSPPRSPDRGDRRGARR